MKLITDPTEHYDVPPVRMLEACGAIPEWILVHQSGTREYSLLRHLEVTYKFGLHEITGGSIDENGVFKYPEDPDQHPYIAIPTPEGTFYMYAHAIVAIPVGGNEHFVTRMD